jgi:RNA polymerase sigma-70 factor (ECF subfamily)
MNDLLQRLKSNDERAFKEVFNTYKLPLYYFIFKIVNNLTEAEDLMMITFEKAFAGVKFFVPNFTFKTWLYEIAKNTSIDFLRSRKIKPKETELNVRIRYKELNPEQALIIKDQYEIVEKGIANINPRLRKVMTMYKDGFKVKEICKELNMPTGTVVNYILCAKKELKKLIA